MLQFKVKNVVPPGGKYPYLVPETGTEISTYSLGETEFKVAQHYRALRLPVPGDLHARIEDYICRRVPAGFCFGDDDGQPRARIASLRTIREATEQHLATRIHALVYPGVAEDRAGCCGKCEDNDRGMCSSCTGLKSWAQQRVRPRRTRLDDWLGVCAQDLVLNLAKVHVGDKTGCPRGLWKE